MLIPTDQIRTWMLEADEATIGRIHDVLFDDQSWTVRYWDVLTDNQPPLEGRRVLVSPVAAEEVRPGDRRVRLNLTPDQLATLPEVDEALPSRAQEAAIVEKMSWPVYWSDSPHLEGSGQAKLARTGWQSDTLSPMGTARLRRMARVTGFAAWGKDDTFGTVDGAIVDTDLWVVRYFTIQEPGQGQPPVLVPPTWAATLDWDRQEMHFSVTTDSLRDSPRLTGEGAFEKLRQP